MDTFSPTACLFFHALKVLVKRGKNLTQKCTKTCFLLFCHHQASKAVELAAGKKHIFPPAKGEDKKCMTLALMTQASLSIFIMCFFSSSTFCVLSFFFPHHFLWVVDWHWLLLDQGHGHLFFLSLVFFCSLYSVSLLTQSHSRFQSLFLVIITCWSAICWRHRGWRPATGHASTTHCQARHLVGWLDVCARTWAAGDLLIYLFTMSLLLA